jgi:hypothetical protein
MWHHDESMPIAEFVPLDLILSPRQQQQKLQRQQQNSTKHKDGSRTKSLVRLSFKCEKTVKKDAERLASEMNLI